MKHAIVLVGARSAHQGKWGGAFASGLRRHGWKADIGEVVTGSPSLVVLWGVRKRRVIDQANREGCEVCILERGYLGNRLAWTSVAFGGGLNNRGQFRGTSDDPARFNKHFPNAIQLWRPKDDGYALLIGQIPNDMSLDPVGGCLDDWYRQASEAMRARGYDVRFRPHPGAVERGYREAVPGAPTINGTLQQALAGAALAVTFNSNAAVDAVLAGLPTLACDEGAMAWPVVGHGLEDPVTMPDRSAWAARLAWKQWTLGEMESGECWARIGEERLVA